MDIDINKKYRTRDGSDVVILKQFDPSQVIHNHHCIIGYIISDGKIIPELWSNIGLSLDQMNDLFEIKKWEQWNIDDPVIIISKATKVRHYRHFAGVNSDGYPMVYKDGMTSYTAPLTTTSPVFNIDVSICDIYHKNELNKIGLSVNR
jgi:hypothetical protein